jgi:hypothetical protein
VLIAPKSILKRKPDIFFATAGTEESVMLDVNTGRYHALNAVASRVWEMLEVPRSISEICLQICEEFDVDKATCETAILAFSEDLVDNGLACAVAP